MFPSGSDESRVPHSTNQTGFFIPGVPLKENLSLFPDSPNDVEVKKLGAWRKQKQPHCRKASLPRELFDTVDKKHGCVYFFGYPQNGFRCSSVFPFKTTTKNGGIISKKTSRLYGVFASPFPRSPETPQNAESPAIGQGFIAVTSKTRSSQGLDCGH